VDWLKSEIARQRIRRGDRLVQLIEEERILARIPASIRAKSFAAAIRRPRTPVAWARPEPKSEAETRNAKTPDSAGVASLTSAFAHAA
jgi:hypothetical protein